MDARLIGRERELARLDRLLDAAPGGAALALRGPRGCGVSALVDAAAARAAARGMGVLRAAGVQAESGFPYAGLHQLLRPLRRAIDELPGAPGDALRAVFGLADAPAPVPGHVALALVALASGAAATRPVLVCVDELQWLDPESRAAVVSFVRRGAQLPVAVLFAGHEEGPPGVTEVRVDPLRPAAAAALLAARAPELTLLARERILRDAAGYPLAVAELPVAFAEAGDGVLLGSWAPLTPALEDVFGAPALEPATARTLLLAALDDSGCVRDVLAASGADAPGVLEPAVAAGLIDLDGVRLAFTHPLTRSAVRHAADPAARREGHEAFATVVAVTDPDRATWHRVVAASGLDAALAAELEAVSWRARDAGDYERAAAGLRRSAHLTPPAPERSRRFVAAAELAEEIGGVELVERLLDEITVDDLDVTARARLTALRTPRGPETLIELAGAVDDRELALRLHWLAAARPYALERQPALPTGLFEDGGPLDQALLGHAALVTGDPWRAACLLDRAAAGLREQRRRTLLGQVLVLSAWAQLALSRLDRAGADAAQGAELTALTRQPSWAAAGHAALATVAAWRGVEADVERHAAEAERLALPAGAASVLSLALQARGALALGAGRPAEAFAQVRRGFDPTDPAFDRPTATLMLGDLAEAATSDEERAFARRLLDAEPWPGAAAAHAALVLADDADADAAFADGSARVGPERPLAVARLQLVHGMRLRRRRRMADSREPLRAAAATFAEHGAAPWAERALRELAATVETAHRGEKHVDRLTPQELEIARMAARGMSNPAIAADLALSPRTIAHHLARIFPKLDVTSRTGIAAALERLDY